MIIDVQCHVFPAAYAQMLLSHAAFPAVKKLGDTDIAVDYGGFVLKIEQSTYAPDKVIAAMDKNGVDVSMISCNIPDVCILGDEWITEASRVTNDAIAETCDKYKGRFFGVASLPWRLTDDSIKELDRVKAMGFKAVHLHSHAGEMMVDDPAMLPIYRHCEKIDMPIVIHPSVPCWAEHARPYNLIPMLSFQMDTSLALMRLVLSGTLEKHPGLRVLMPHAGGVIPYMEGRIHYQTAVRKRGIDNISIPVKEQLRNRNVWYDTVAPSVETLGFLKNYVSAEKIMFGTDYPFVEGKIFVDLIDELGFTDEERSKVLWKNANDFFMLGL